MVQDPKVKATNNVFINKLIQKKRAKTKVGVSVEEEDLRDKVDIISK